jgi:glucosamine--fructose-6-phosphate aminotransferase (isomerizing)
LGANIDNPDALKSIAAEASNPIRKAFEETSRPVDTIRHQAKTVTVGTSRPEDALSPVVRDALGALALADSRLSFSNRKTLAAVSRIVDSVKWSALLEIDARDGINIARADADVTLPSPIKDYQDGAPAIGVIGASLDTNGLICGFVKDDAVIAVPVTAAQTADVEHVLCLSVGLVAHASREQKSSVMQVLGTYQTKLREWEQHFGAEAEAQLQRQIARELPSTIVFRPTALDPMLSTENKQSA